VSDVEQLEGVVRRPLQGATVKPGNRGDYSVLVWVRTEGEAEKLAKLINDYLRRRREAQDADP
jgi:hypothetical protein